MTFLFALGCYVFLALFGVTLFLMLRHRDQQRLQDRLLRGLVEARDQQKEVIFRNMHDHVNPMLRSVMRNIESHKAALKKNKLRPEALEQDIDVLLMALNDIRSCTHEEVPASLRDEGFVTLLQEMLQRITSAAGIRTRFINRTIFDKYVPFDLLRQLDMYRISSELIENVVRHASGTFLDLTLFEIDQSLVLRFEYDGSGLTNAEAAELRNSGNGTGLRSSEARARLLNAEIEYSCAQASCAVELRVYKQWKSKLR